ncbi:MAG: TolC family protein [Candidatus Omnitrophica bacterium]|nr:TolC family protein [Candidatus Omnitrophota bacterium]
MIVVFIFLFQALVPFNFAAAQELLTWDGCIKEAAKNHPDLISASEAIKESVAAKKITSSGEYPQVSASLSASKSKAGSNPSVDSYSTSLSASQLVFDGKKTINNVKAAQENIQAAKHNFRFTSSEVRQALRVAFVNLLKAQEMTRISREIFEIRRANLELITLRYQSGLEHRGALLTAEANLAEAQYNINTAVHELRVAQMNLSKQLGRGKWSALSVSADFTVRDIPSQDIDLEALAKNNPQILKLTAQKNSAEFNLRSAYGGFAPSVSVSANTGKTGATFFPQNTEKGIGLSLNLPLFEGGLKTAQVAQAEAALNQLKENERSSRDSVIATLEQYRAALLEAIDNVDVQNKSLLATVERSKIAEAQYSIGTISFDSWTIIEDNLVSAKRAYLNAQADAMLAEANWIMAKGETLE